MIFRSPRSTGSRAPEARRELPASSAHSLPPSRTVPRSPSTSRTPGPGATESESATTSTTTEAPVAKADLAVELSQYPKRVEVPLYQVKKEIPPSAKVGYTVSVTNKGPDEVSDAVLLFDGRFQNGVRLADPTAYAWFTQYSQKTPPDTTCLYRDDGLDYRCVVGELASGETHTFRFSFELAGQNQMRRARTSRTAGRPAVSWNKPRRRARVRRVERGRSSAKPA